jgi:hypothetical protein
MWPHGHNLHSPEKIIRRLHTSEQFLNQSQSLNVGRWDQSDSPVCLMQPVILV